MYDYILIIFLMIFFIVAWFIYKWRQTYDLYGHTFIQSLCEHEFVDIGVIATSATGEDLHKLVCSKCLLAIVVNKKQPWVISWKNFVEIRKGRKLL